MTFSYLLSTKFVKFKIGRYFDFFGGYMTITEMLGQSGLLTLLGMGVVFAFLIILIICMNALHGVLHLLGKDKDKPVETPASAAAPVVADETEVVAAIAAAIKAKNS